MYNLPISKRVRLKRMGTEVPIQMLGIAINIPVLPFQRYTNSLASLLLVSMGENYCLVAEPILRLFWFLSTVLSPIPLTLERSATD